MCFPASAERIRCCIPLIDCLTRIGIRNKASESYLTIGYYPILVNGWESSSRKLVYGVTQGTVIGPILFMDYLPEVFSFKI